MLTTLVMGALIYAAPVQQTDTVIPVQPGTRLEMDTFGGEVVIQSWSRNEIRIVASHSSRTAIEIARIGSTVRVEAESWRGVATVDYEITVPASTPVDVEGTFAAVEVDGVQAEIRVETVQGNITVNGGRGYVSLHSTQGDVELRGATGDLRVHSVNGSIRIMDAAGSVVADAINGTITLSGVEFGEVQATTVNGTVRFEGTIDDAGRYHLGTHSGNVILALPERVNATVSVSTFSGDFSSAFPVTLRETRSHGRQFTFTLGNGGARVELESFSGSIELRRR